MAKAKKRKSTKPRKVARKAPKKAIKVAPRVNMFVRDALGALSSRLTNDLQAIIEAHVEETVRAAIDRAARETLEGSRELRRPQGVQAVADDEPFDGVLIGGP